MWESSASPILTFGAISAKPPVTVASDPSQPFAFPPPVLSPAGSPSVGQTLSGATVLTPWSPASPAVGDRLLLTADSGVTGAAGIWTVTSLGGSPVLARATDADTPGELPIGASVLASEFVLTGVAHAQAGLFVLGSGGTWDLQPGLLAFLTVLGQLTLGDGSFSNPLVVNGDVDLGTSRNRVLTGNPQGDALVPPGAIVAYGGATAPVPGWLLCDGSSYLRTDYPDLFAAIGTAYGAADGTHFSVPDLRGRFPVGAGTGPGTTLGATGGTWSHTHTGPSHTHTSATHLHTFTATHTHTGPSHTHTGPSHTHSHNHQSAIDSSGGGIGSKATPNWGQGSAFTANRAVSQGTVSIAAHFDLTDTDATAGGTGATGASGTAATGATAPGSTDNATPGATGASGTAATGTANPPYQVVQYIIHT